MSPELEGGTGLTPSTWSNTRATYLDNLAKPFVATAAIRTYPAAGAEGTANTFNNGSKSNYSEIIAATAQDDYILGVYVLATSDGVCHFEVNIATGAAAAEVDVIELKGGGEVPDTNRDIGYYFPLTIPVAVAAGSRLSCRGQDTSGQACKISLTYTKQSDVV